MPVRNFAFGSHLVKERMSKSIGAEPQKSLRATLSNYRLTFWKVNTYPEEFDRYATSGGFPVLVPANGNPVHEAAYMTSEDQLAGLDKSEREFGYERAEFLVDIPEMGSVRAFAHNRNDNGEFYPPSQDFLEIMLKDLKNTDIPQTSSRKERSLHGLRGRIDPKPRMCITESNKATLTGRS